MRRRGTKRRCLGKLLAAMTGCPLKLNSKGRLGELSKKISVLCLGQVCSSMWMRTLQAAAVHAWRFRAWFQLSLLMLAPQKLRAKFCCPGKFCRNVSAIFCFRSMDVLSQVVQKAFNSVDRRITFHGASNANAHRNFGDVGLPPGCQRDQNTLQETICWATYAS